MFADVLLAHHAGADDRVVQGSFGVSSFGARRGASRFAPIYDMSYVFYKNEVPAGPTACERRAEPAREDTRVMSSVDGVGGAGACARADSGLAPA